MTTRSAQKANAGVLATLRRRNTELETMVELGKALTATLDLKEVLAAVMGSVQQLIRATSWSVLLVDEAGGDLVFEAVVSPAAERLLGRRLPAGSGIAGLVARSGEALFIADLNTYSGSGRPQLETTEPARSIVCVPLRSAEQILGVIELINPYDAGFDDSDAQLLMTIADFAAIAVENARNYQRIRQLVITDDLTGLYNARHMSRLIEHEVERAHRYNTPLTLVFIDLDYFKHVNDNYGHLAGSRLLGEVGAFIRQHIRKIDLAARYGGDEFVLILPGTPKSGARILCQHILDELRQHDFLCSGPTPPVRITASLGIAAYPEDALDKDQLLGRADQAMYKVKATTRNAVRSAGDPE